MAAEFQRDRWGRPMIIPTGGGKAIAYSRFSSHGQVLEDRFGLEKWKIRTSALGLVARQDLFAQLASIPADDSKRIDEILTQALEAGGGSVIFVEVIFGIIRDHPACFKVSQNTFEKPDKNPHRCVRIVADVECPSAVGSDGVDDGDAMNGYCFRPTVNDRLRAELVG